MDKILSQDEVDALLRGVDTGEIATEAGRPEPTDGYPSYDFTAQERIIRGRMPGLEMANERFSRLFRDSLASVLMRFVDVNVHGVEMVMFSEFMKTVPMPSSINIFKMEPLNGYALYVMEAPMVFALIEYFFGGGASLYTKSEGRYFTPIEQRVIRKISGLALRDLGEAWQSLEAIEPEYISLEMNPQFVTIVTPTEGVIKIEVHVDIEEFTGKVFFCIPYSMVEPIKDKLFSGIKGDRMETDARWVERLKGVLGESVAHLSAEIGEVEITVGDLIELEVGDVIPLGKAVSDPLLLRVEGVPKFAGVPGYSRGAQALKLTNMIEGKAERNG